MALLVVAVGARMPDVSVVDRRPANRAPATAPAATLPVAPIQPAPVVRSYADTIGSEAYALDAVRPALVALERIEAATDVGVGAAKYAELLQEATLQVRLASRDPNAGPGAMRHLAWALECYQNGLGAINAMSDPKQDQLIGFHEVRLKSNWRSAGEAIDKAKDLLGVPVLR